MLGLYVSCASEETATPEAPFTGENNKKCDADVVAETVFRFCAVVAVPVTFPVTLPT